jgi:hypothetical protein
MMPRTRREPRLKTELTALGAYEVDVDEEAVRAAMECRGDARLVEDELSSLALVELLVRNAPPRFLVTKFSLGPLDQAPWDATYFDAETDDVIACHFEQPGRRDFRICFYLHFYDPTEVLRTPYGDVELPPLTPMPDRLSHLHYEYFD